MGDGPEKNLEAIELGNEFATVHVRKVFTRNGVRLDISSPRLGYSIRLDPLALESLTWQNIDVISKFLETPYGPTEGPPHRPQSLSRRK